MAAQHATGEPGDARVDIPTIGSLAAAVRRQEGEPAWRAICAKAEVDPERFASDDSTLRVGEFEAFLAAIRGQLDGEDALLALLGRDTPGRARWLRWFVTPGLLYRAHARRRWLTAGIGSMRCSARGLGSVIVRYTGAGPEGRLLCLFRQARLIYLPTAWALPPAVVRETGCLARGDDACTYAVHWYGRPRWTPAGIAVGVSLGAVGTTVAGPWVSGCVAVLAGGLAHELEMRRVQAASRAAQAEFGAALRQAASGLASPRASAGDCVLRQEGDFWRVGFEGKVVLIQGSRGLALLAHLLRNPGQAIHVTTLDTLIPSDVAALPLPRPVGSVEGTISHDLGDAGEVLDAGAKAAYRHRVAELREEIDDAEACNDPGRTGRARAELDAITEQLREATGLGGRSRRAASSADRVRVAVSRRIRAAVTQIAKHHPALASHLTASIRTGYFCSYEPAERRVWRT